MKVSKKTNEDYNWLMLKDKKFIFNKYKTFTTYGQQNIDICEELVEILSAYLKHHPLKKEKEFFLLIDNGAKISESFIKTTLTKLLGKNIGVSMFRNIFLSSEFNFENVKKVEVQKIQKNDELSYYGKRIVVLKALVWDELYDRKIDIQLRNRLVEIFKKEPSIVDLDSSLRKTRQRQIYEFDYKRGGALAVSANQVALSVKLLFSENKIGSLGDVSSPEEVDVNYLVPFLQGPFQNVSIHSLYANFLGG
jgi:hypothetical protein